MSIAMVMRRINRGGGAVGFYPEGFLFCRLARFHGRMILMN
jgi:hypothetical protein